MRPRARKPAGALFAFALVVNIGGLAIILLRASSGADPAELALAGRMRASMAAVAEELAARGIAIDRESDPAASGLIGIEWSGITTTLGNLPAKRSAAQPASAVLLRRLMEDAGLRPGDMVAIDSSGSFPGFAIAAILAAESLGAKSLVIVSVGSSTWGANRPEFALPDILASLAARGLLPHGADAVSPGGAGDEGGDMDPLLLGAILDRAAAGGSRVLGAKSLAADIALRRAFFSGEADGGRAGKDPALLVSIGGNLSSTGPGDRLAGSSGLLRPSDFRGGGRLSRVSVPGWGLVQSFLVEGLPVIRLIDVKDLAARTGLPWDPYPWPADPGLPPRSGPATRLIAIATIGLAFLAAWALGRSRPMSR